MVQLKQLFKDKKRLKHEIRNIFLILLGSVVLAFGSSMLEPFDIISGGVLSIGIIFNSFIEPLAGFNITDIVVAIVQVVLWLVGLFFVGRHFSMRTLLSSLAYPLFYSLFLRLNVADYIWGGASSFENLTYMLLAGLFGGFLTGAGVAISYRGEGSTGGLDVISKLLAKHTRVKEDTSSFLMDATLIVIGVIVTWDFSTGVVPCLIGILGALCCALAIQYLYIRSQRFLECDIISSHYQEIMNYVHDELGHGTTVFKVYGGYLGEERRLLRVIIYKNEEEDFRNKIGEIDPKAFVSFITTKTINGEGFEPLLKNKVRLKNPFNGKRKKKDLKDEDDGNE